MCGGNERHLSHTEKNRLRAKKIKDEAVYMRHLKEIL